MIIPPKPWVAYDEGGYFGDLAAFYTFLRLKGVHNSFSKGYKARLAQLDTPDVYKAVNAIQATPWHINKDVLEVIKQCKERGYIPVAKKSHTS